VLSLLLLVVLCVGAGSVLAGAPAGRLVPRAAETGPPQTTYKGSDGGIKVIHAYNHAVSARLRTLRPERPGLFGEFDASPNPRPLSQPQVAVDPVRQSAVFPKTMSAPSLTFDGIAMANGCGACIPPDTNGEVGATQYVQTVNSAFQVFDKSNGSSLLGPLQISQLWAGLGGSCEFGGWATPSCSTTSWRTAGC